MPLSVPSAFLILYGVVSVYFSGAMVRLMLVLAPAACILAGIGLSEGLHVFARSLKHGVVNMKDAIAKEGEEDEDEVRVIGFAFWICITPLNCFFVAFWVCLTPFLDGTNGNCTHGVVNMKVANAKDRKRTTDEVRIVGLIFRSALLIERTIMYRAIAKEGDEDEDKVRDVGSALLGLL